jgi:hypothetical protein
MKLSRADAAPESPAPTSPFNTKPPAAAAVQRARVDAARRSTAALFDAIAKHAPIVLDPEVDADTFALARLEGFDLVTARDYAKTLLSALEIHLPKD